MTNTYILSIDAGTTTIRGVIFDAAGQIVAKEIKKVPQISPHPGWLEQDPEIIYDTVQSTIADVLINGHISANQLASLALTNQRETTVVWDKATGHPVYNAIVWRSNQTKAIIDQYKNQIDARLIHEKTGLRLDAIFSASKIRFILDQVPDGQARGEAGELLFGTINTWLAWRLSDGEIFVTDHTNASRTLLFNIHTLTWDEELCRLFDIPQAMLPTIVANDTIVGHTNHQPLLNQNIPIAAMIGSQQAALFGQTAFDEGMVKATFGSGGFIVMNTGTKPRFSNNNLLTSVGYSLSQQTHYVLEGYILTAGDAIDWFIEQLDFLTSYQAADTAANTSQNENELYFVPAFNGLAAPYWDPNVRGAFLGLTRGSTRDDLIKAGLQAIAYQTADILTTMSQDTHLPLARLKVDGGASQSAYLLQFVADMTKTSVQRSQSLETTALGAAMIAGLNTGFFKDFATLQQLNIGGERFEPALDAKTRQQLYAGWHQAVAAAQIFK
ncbi:glycerol kinase GlpK [Agrilactobacillus yilanensis]|uniref:Glycerol kinase GlpK n=1 Tax=Agrilactobacillus yilanensis TaxID=2485997 RepID=A0ABW4JA98_9LACO|nr:glycerol kinase GlpK [Agrilactobacillus yilanensis]